MSTIKELEENSIKQFNESNVEQASSNEAALSSEIPSESVEKKVEVYNLNAKEYIPKSKKPHPNAKYSNWKNIRSSKFNKNIEFPFKKTTKKSQWVEQEQKNNEEVEDKENKNTSNYSDKKQNTYQESLVKSSNDHYNHSNYNDKNTSNTNVSLQENIKEDKHNQDNKYVKENIMKDSCSYDNNYHSKVTCVNDISNEENNFNSIDSKLEKTKLRLLIRFNCGKCQNKYSKILIPSMFLKPCEKCRSDDCELVVLRCNDNVLYGGYLCNSCDHRFLNQIEFNEFKTITPYCFDCNKVVKVYQILLNRSKISVRNEKVFICIKCFKKETQSYYQPYGWKKPSKMRPICCNVPMEYSHLNRSLKYHLLDEQGRSEMYTNNWDKRKNSKLLFNYFYFIENEYKSNWHKLFVNCDTDYHQASHNTNYNTSYKYVYNSKKW